jgi:hypothetical protein
MPDLQRRYKALSDIIVGGRLLFARGSIFDATEQYGSALVKEGRAQPLAALEQPKPPRHKRRDMRAEDNGE